MNKHLTRLAALAALALLSACGHHHGQLHGHGMHMAGLDPARPMLLVDAATAVPSMAVSPHTLSFAPSQREVEIVWRLPKAKAPGERQFRFLPDRGVTIVGEVKYKVQRLAGKNDPVNHGADGNDLTYIDPQQNEIVDCRVLEDGLAFRCLNRHTRPGKFKYALIITDGKDIFAIDPPLANW